MKRRLQLACVFAMLALPVAQAAAPASRGQAIFNGTNLDGWVAEGAKEFKDKGQVKPVWTVQDGLLVCAGKGYGFLRYVVREFGDFALHVEYRMTRSAKGQCNSGIGIRTVPYDTKRSEATRPSYASYEIQLLDDAGQPPNKHGSGSLYRYVAPRANPVKAAPEWNTVDVKCVGPRIRIRINGQEVLDVDQSKVKELKDKPLRGYVCLQNHGGRIEFRNLRIEDFQAPAGK